MNKTKKLLILILALTMLLVGCSGAKNDTEKDKAEVTPEATPAPTNTPEPTATPIPEPKSKTVDFWYSLGCIYKLYENGEYGYHGEDFIQNYSSEIYTYIQRAFIINQVPPVLDDYSYEEYTERKEEGKENYQMEFFCEDDVDYIEYYSTYGEQLEQFKDEIGINILSSMKYRDIKPFYFSIASNYGQEVEIFHDVVLYDTDDIKGGVCSGMILNWNAQHYLEANVFPDIEMVDIASNKNAVFGLDTEGKVHVAMLSDLYTLDNEFQDFNTDIKYNVSGWSNIVQISAGEYNVVGLKDDGTCVAAGELDIELGDTKMPIDVSEWTDIRDLAVGGSMVVGITNADTLVSTGLTCFVENILNVDNVKDVKISDYSLLILDNDGKLHVRGVENYGNTLYYFTHSPDKIKDIAAIQFVDGVIYAMNSNSKIITLDISSAFLYNEEFSTDVEYFEGNSIFMEIKNSDGYSLTGFAGTENLKPINESYGLMEEYDPASVMQYRYEPFVVESGYSNGVDGSLKLDENGTFTVDIYDSSTEELKNFVFEDCGMVDYLYLSPPDNDYYFHNEMYYLGEDNTLYFVNLSNLLNDDVPATLAEMSEPVAELDADKYVKMDLYGIKGQTLVVLYNDGTLFEVTEASKKLFLQDDYYNWLADKQLTQENITEIYGEHSYSSITLLEFNTLYGAKVPEFKYQPLSNVNHSCSKSFNTGGCSINCAYGFDSNDAKYFDEYIKDLEISGFTVTITSSGDDMSANITHPDSEYSIQFRYNKYEDNSYSGELSFDCIVQ